MGAMWISGRGNDQDVTPERNNPPNQGGGNVTASHTASPSTFWALARAIRPPSARS